MDLHFIHEYWNICILIGNPHWFAFQSWQLSCNNRKVVNYSHFLHSTSNTRKVWSPLARLRFMEVSLSSHQHNWVVEVVDMSRMLKCCDDWRYYSPRHSPRHSPVSEAKRSPLKENSSWLHWITWDKCP